MKEHRPAGDRRFWTRTGKFGLEPAIGFQALREKERGLGGRRFCGCISNGIIVNN